MKDGEAVTNLAMTIARGGVITGVVRDVGGRPVPGLNVRVLKLGYNAVTGERTLGAPGQAAWAVTDDRGEYRAFGLPPGGYLVVVVPPVSSGRGNDDIRQLTAAEVRQALQAARSGASPAQPGRASRRCRRRAAGGLAGAALELRPDLSSRRNRHRCGRDRSLSA